MSRNPPARDDIEGGIAGLIDVRLHRPFDFDGLEIAGTVHGTHSSLSDHTDPDGSLLVSDRWQTGIGEMGLLVDLSFRQDHYKEEISTTISTHRALRSRLAAALRPDQSEQCALRLRSADRRRAVDQRQPSARGCQRSLPMEAQRRHGGLCRGLRHALPRPEQRRLLRRPALDLRQSEHDDAVPGDGPGEDRDRRLLRSDERPVLRAERRTPIRPRRGRTGRMGRSPCRRRPTTPTASSPRPATSSTRITIRAPTRPTSIFMIAARPT